MPSPTRVVNIANGKAPNSGLRFRLRERGWEVHLPGIKEERYTLHPLVEGQLNLAYFELLAEVLCHREHLEASGALAARRVGQRRRDPHRVFELLDQQHAGQSGVAQEGGEFPDLRQVHGMAVHHLDAAGLANEAPMMSLTRQ